MRKPFGQPDAPEQEQPNMFWFEDCSAALHHPHRRPGRKPGAEG